MNKAEAALELGMAESEIIDLADSPAGPVVQTFDGNWMVKVDGDADAQGRTGWMFLIAPVVPGGYKGTFPVFENPEDDDEFEVTTVDDGGDGDADSGDADGDVVDLAELSHEQLLAHARTLGVDVKGNWGTTRILEALADHAAKGGDGNETGE